jgi:hypothetical protein
MRRKGPATAPGPFNSTVQTYDTCTTRLQLQRGGSAHNMQAKAQQSRCTSTKRETHN